MSYEYFMHISRFKDAADPAAQFLMSFRGSPHAFYGGDGAVLFKESPAEGYPHFDARLVPSRDGIVLQVNRRCESLFDLFSKILADAEYSIHEEEDEANVPLKEAFRIR